MSKKYFGKTCPYCKTPLLETDVVAVCGTCDMPHHLSCWQDNQGCTTFGCTGTIREIIGSTSGVVAQPIAPQTEPQTLPEKPTPPPEKPTPPPVRSGGKAVEVLSESKETVFLEGVPLTLESTALIIDRNRDQLFARCTFRCLSDRAISAVQIQITCQEIWGNQLGEPVVHQYLDLKTKRDTLFGQTSPIDLPDKNTRRIQVTVLKVMFADGSLVSGGGVAFTMPATVLLSAHLGSKELAAEYARETSPRAQFVPVQADHYWRCACGSVNTDEEERCCNCGCTYEQLTTALNPEQLGENMRNLAAAQRAAAEKEQAERAERIRQAEEAVAKEQKKQREWMEFQEKEEKRQKNKKKVTVIAMVSAVAVVALLCVTWFWGMPYATYQQACKQLDGGDYDLARATFLKLDGFMDSEDMALECLYQKGKALLKEEQFDNAIQIFKGLDDYSDSAKMVKESKYLKACDYVEKANYTNAVGIFEELGDYKDSADKCKNAKYKYVQVTRNNDNKTTYQYLVDLKSTGYKDADTIYDELYTWTVIGGINTKQNDYNTHQPSISKYCSYLHCWLYLDGGTPGEEITLTHTTIYPDGEVRESSWDWENQGDGDTFSAEWINGLYDTPQYGDTGTLTIKVYNKKTGELLGKVTTYIGN